MVSNPIILDAYVNDGFSNERIFHGSGKQGLRFGMLISLIVAKYESDLQKLKTSYGEVLTLAQFLPKENYTLSVEIKIQNEIDVESFTIIDNHQLGRSLQRLNIIKHVANRLYRESFKYPDFFLSELIDPMKDVKKCEPLVRYLKLIDSHSIFLEKLKDGNVDDKPILWLDQWHEKYGQYNEHYSERINVCLRGLRSESVMFDRLYNMDFSNPLSKRDEAESFCKLIALLRTYSEFNSTNR